MIYKENIIPEQQQEESKINQANSNTGKSRWLVIFSILLALILLYLALYNLDWNSFWKIIKTGRYEFLLLTLPLSTINYFIRALRWNTLVSSKNKTPVLSVFWANMVGYMGNVYLPARAGEILRSVFLGKKSGGGTSFILATALTERVLDALVLVLLGSVAMLWQNNMPTSILAAVQIMAFFSTAGILVIIVTPFQENLIVRILELIPLPQNIMKRILEQLTRFLTGMRSLQSLRTLILFLLLTGVIWFLDGIGTVIGANIVFKTLNLGQAFILLAGLGLSSAIPSTPGYVGIYQFVAVTVLVPFGFSKSDALAYILISQFVNYILVGILGLLGLLQLNKAREKDGV